MKIKFLYTSAITDLFTRRTACVKEQNQDKMKFCS